MDLQEIIRTSLLHYDTYTEKYKNILSNIKYVVFDKTDDDLKHNKMNAYDENDKLLFTSRYEGLGRYYPSNSSWIWYWAIPNAPLNTTNISRNILNYALKINSFEHMTLKSELITSRYYVSNEIQLEIHSAISIYLSKKTCLFKFDQSKISIYDKDLDAYYNDNIIFYLILFDI